VNRIEDRLRDAYTGEAGTVTPGSIDRLSEAIAAGLRTDRNMRHRRDARSRRLFRVVTPIAAAAAVTVAIVLATQVLPRLANSQHNHASTSRALPTSPVARPLTGTFITSFKLPGNARVTSILWNVVTRHLTATMVNPDGQPVTSVTLTPAGNQLAASDDQGHIFVWDTASGKLTQTLVGPGSEGGVSVLAFGPDGFSLAAGRVGSTSLWDTFTRQRAATLTDKGHSYRVDSLAFGPSGSPLAVGDDNGSVFLWRITRLTP
jgi:WD40 repeat protein